MRKVLHLLLYALGMAYCESAVVAYLRELYYPSGFSIEALDKFPLRIYLTEVGREVATLVMITTVSLLSFSRVKGRIGSFLFIFGLWDIFYYLLLYLLIHWPPSLKTLDVLFLIPIPWIAPIYIPVAIASGMVLVGFFLVIKSPAY